MKTFSHHNTSIRSYVFLLRCRHSFFLLLTFFLFQLFCNLSLNAQKQSTENHTTKSTDKFYTTTSIQQRQFDAKQLDKYRNNKTYLYDRPPPNPSILEQIIRWLSQKTGKTIGNTFDWIFEYVQYIFVILIIIMVIMRLLQSDWNTLFVRKSRVAIGYQNLKENIHELDFDKLLKEAIAQKKYRRAIRLYYLKTLKKLSDKELINWQINKTNQQYLAELHHTSLQIPFDHLTYLFDHTYYGDCLLDEHLFQQTQAQFLQFQQKVKQHK